MDSNSIATLRALNQSRPARPATDRKILQRKPMNERRVVGMGSLGQGPDTARLKAAAGVGDRSAVAQGLGSLIDAIRASNDCPVWNMDVIEQVRWDLQGPVTPETTTALFGAEIDLFGSGKAPSGIDYVESTMAQPGETQTNMIACYIGFHLEPEPLCWTVQGNAWTYPSAAPAQTPISPDVFTVNDVTNGALGIPAGTTYVHGVAEWGWWANYAAWMLARAYNLRWKVGQHTNIMDEVLRHTAYTPPSAQEGSASNSQVDTTVFINRMNTRYVSTVIGSPLAFLRQNRIRLGSTTVGGANVGVFSPSNSSTLVGATYGGMDLRSMLRGNSEFRKLTLPYLIKAGIPIGLYLQENDTFQGNIMRQYLDVTYGTGITPALIYDAPNLNAANSGSGVTPVSTEILLNQATPAGVAFQQTQNEVAVFKGGELKISLMVKGFEVSEDWYNVMAQDPTIRAVVMSECGINVAVQGAS